MARSRAIPIYLRAPSRGLITAAVVAFGCVAVYMGVRQSWVLAAVVVFGAGTAVLALMRMEYAILGLVIMANFDGFLKPLFATRFSLFLKDFFVLLALMRWLWGLFSNQERPSTKTPMAVPALLLIGYVFAEIANPNAHSVLASLDGARAWIVWLPVFFVAYDYLRTRAAVERLWLAALVCGGIAGVYGIVQYRIGIEHLFALSSRFEWYQKMAYYTESGERIIRVFSTMVHPGTFGAAMGAMCLVALAMALSGKSKTARIVALVSLAPMAAGLILSGARSAWAGTGLGLVLLVLLSRRPALLLGLPVLIAAGWVWSMNETQGAMSDRLASMRAEDSFERITGPLVAGMEVMGSHPFGLGLASGSGAASFGLDTDAITTPFLENDFGRAMGELGVGGILYFALLFMAAYCAFRSYARLPRGSDPTMAAGMIAVMACIGLGLLTGKALYLAPGAIYFWLALAVVMRLPALTAAEVAETREVREASPAVLAGG